MTAPFFIVGFQRSGTTLLRLMLDQHPDLAIPLDTTGLWSRYEALHEQGSGASDPLAVRRLVESLLAEERIQLWEAGLTVDQVLAARTREGFAGIIEAFYTAYARSRGKRTWGDKDPGNMLRIGTVVRWFPDARFIHIIRDGRDACLSQLEQSFGFSDCLPCAEAWREQVQWVRRIGEMLGPGRYWEVRYEDLLADPAQRLTQACGFLGVAFDPAMLEYHKHVERSIPASKRHIWPLLAEPPRKDNVGRWRTRMSGSARVAFEKRAGLVLRECGYETLPGRPTGGYVAELQSGFQRLIQGIRRRLGRHL